MKKYLVIALLLVATISKAQTKETVQMPSTVAKKIAKELVECDGIKEEYILTKEQLIATQDIVKVKDSIIALHITKESILNDRLVSQEQKYNTLQKYTGGLETQSKTDRVRSKIIMIAATAIIASLSTIYITH